MENSSIEKYNQHRISNYTYVKRVISKVAMIDNKRVVVAGWKRPRIILFDNYNDNNRTIYTYLIPNKKKFNKYVKNGYSIYYLTGIRKYNKKVYNIDLKILGAKELKIKNKY